LTTEEELAASINPTNCLKLLVRARKMFDALGVMAKILKLMFEKD
jgi:hypothetical protein